MKLTTSSLITLLAIWSLRTENLIVVVVAKKPIKPQSSATTNRRNPSSEYPPAGPNGSRPRVSRRRTPTVDEEEEDEEEYGDAGDDSGPPPTDEDEEEDFIDEEEEEEDLRTRPKSKKASTRSQPVSTRPTKDAPPKSSNLQRKKGLAQGRPARRFEEDEDSFRPKGRPGPTSGVPPRGQQRPAVGSRPPGRPGPGGPAAAGRRPGSVVPYTRPQPSVFTRGLDAIRSSIPDPSTIREVASNSLNAARATTASLSANVYREIKGLTSSELEQVLLKSTRPDDSAVKGKHVERLVGVTYQISARYDIYDAVLRKLWAKMAEKDWRTKIKALYILHRFSADGAPEHAAALKARLRELRRTKDPKRKDKYFNSKQLLAGDSKPDTAQFRAFLSRYAHYVLLRAQCFGGIFDEISSEQKVDKKKPPKPITSVALRAEHLEAAVMLLKAGLACQLKEGEECENNAIAAERVASDMIGLTTAVAIALNRVLKEPSLKGADPVLIKKWCELYKNELVPQTRAMVKKLSTKLDAYGLFLPTRMGTSVSPELLERGLNLEAEEKEAPASSEGDKAESGGVQTEQSQESQNDEAGEQEEPVDEEEKKAVQGPKKSKKIDAGEEEVSNNGEAMEDGEEEEDEYDDDDEEYYDDDEE